MSIKPGTQSRSSLPLVYSLCGVHPSHLSFLFHSLLSTQIVSPTGHAHSVLSTAFLSHTKTIISEPSTNSTSSPPFLIHQRAPPSQVKVSPLNLPTPQEQTTLPSQQYHLYYPPSSPPWHDDLADLDRVRISSQWDDGIRARSIQSAHLFILIISYTTNHTIREKSFSGLYKSAANI